MGEENLGTLTCEQELMELIQRVRGGGAVVHTRENEAGAITGVRVERMSDAVSPVPIGVGPDWMRPLLAVEPLRQMAGAMILEDAACSPTA